VGAVLEEEKAMEAMAEKRKQARSEKKNIRGSHECLDCWTITVGSSRWNKRLVLLTCNVAISWLT
jgi:hypothetical protein